MPKLTIHTATYNRAYILPKAYESLKAQTCKDFEWIITDDGSTDGTDVLVESWMKAENGFPIFYNRLEHVGIPRALNSGVNLAHTDWFMMLDSDDWIKPITVEKVIVWLQEIENNMSYIGIGFAKCLPDDRLPKDQEILLDKDSGYIDATNIERPLYHLDMDMEEVSRVSLLRKYPFQVWPTERYAPEQLNYNEIALSGYKYRWRDEKLYVCDYLPDGQTKDNGLVKRNPMGFAMMHNQNMKIRNRFTDKCKCAIQMTALCLVAGEASYLKKTNCLAATVLTFPIGVALSFRRRRQFMK